MEINQFEVDSQGALVIDQETLRQANLSGRLRLLVRKEEIRIVPETALALEKALRELDSLAAWARSQLQNAISP